MSIPDVNTLKKISTQTVSGNKIHFPVENEDFGFFY